MLRRLIHGILIILAGVICVFFIWLNTAPRQEMNFDRLSLAEPCFYFRLDIDKDNISGLNFVIDHLGLGFIKASALKAALPVFLPCRIKLAGYFTAAREKPVITAFIKSRKFSRLSGFFLEMLEASDAEKEKWQRIYYDSGYLILNKKKLNAGKINSYAVYEDVTCLSMRPDFLKDVLSSYPSEYSFDWDEKILMMCGIHNRGDLVLIADNQKQDFTSLIERAQNKSSFGFFPSIASVSYINLFLKNIDARGAAGELVFVCRPDVEFSRVKADMDFFRLVLKRVCYNKNLDFEAFVSESENKIILEFNIRGVKK